MFARIWVIKSDLFFDKLEFLTNEFLGLKGIEPMC